MPAADFCHTVRMNHSTLSSASGTCDRPPEVSSTAFNAQPPDLQPAPLMDLDFAVIGPLVRRRMPPIRFLFIDSRLCSTLLSDPASRRRPCASLSLLLHQDVKRTYTSKLLNMLGTPKKIPLRREAFWSLFVTGIELNTGQRSSYPWLALLAETTGNCRLGSGCARTRCLPISSASRIHLPWTEYKGRDAFFRLGYRPEGYLRSMTTLA
jgi:hypothetical protein